MDHFLKITYHSSASKKMNAYLKMPSPSYRVLKKEIEMCLFDERQQPRCEIRTFWIDEDQDEIEILSQCDYDIFMAKRSERQHLQVAPIGVATEVPVAPSTSANTASAPAQSTVPPAAGSYEFAVHERVECDGCLMAPIMGFRYKCIQCPNFDLCQNCEAKHVHSEHMMVRMPTNNCPGVVEAYVTGRTSAGGRRHGSKRSKSGTGCPFVVKNGISVIIDDDNENIGVASGEQSSASPGNGGKERHHGRKHGHRRHHRNNFLSHLYEMMHDLAEGGGAAAAEAATGQTATTSSSTTTNMGPTTTSTTTNLIGFENLENNVNATAAAAHMAAQKAHETAVKTAEIAAKVAHETALQSAKKVTENNAAAPKQGNEKTQDKDDVPSTSQSEQTPIPVLPSPTLETIAQFLDPQYMKTGIQILNNFSDMFAKMLDPMDGAEGGDACPFAANLRKHSTTSTKSSVSSNLNSMESDKKSEKSEKLSEKSMEKSLEKPEQTPETKQPESDVSSNVEIDDLGSDSETDSVSETFIKLDAPLLPKTGDIVTSTHTTPPQSLNKSNVMDFAQLSANLKAHIAEEAVKEGIVTPTETAKVATEQLLSEEINNASPKITTTTNTTTSSSSNSSTTSEPKTPQEKRAVPVYHTDQRINNSVIAMMSMGFSNEGAWLTQLLESVNGNIAEALDLMSVAQRTGR